MRSSRLFRRVIAGLCAAAMLCGGMAASAAAPALPAAPAAVEATNAAPRRCRTQDRFFQVHRHLRRGGRRLGFFLSAGAGQHG